MATTNFTEDEGHKTLAELSCTTELTGSIHSQLICLSVINIFLSITALLGNTLILVALHKESSLHPTSKLLFRTLATTDLCVGIITEPLFVAQSVAMVTERWKICQVAFTASHITGYVLGPVSLLTLTAISVDRLLALRLGLRYRQVANLKRIYATVTVFWVLAIVGASMYFLGNLRILWFGSILTSLCLLTAVSSYMRIFMALRENRTQVQNHVNQEQPNRTGAINMARYKKTVYSALWVQLALVICYLPLGTVEALITQKGLTSSLFRARNVVATLVFLNSTLNPILYCWKIREVKQAVKDTLKQLYFSFC